MVRKESYLVHEAWGDHQLKKDEARGLEMKTVTGRERSVCFAQVVPVMHAAELLEVCTTWKGNKDTHTAKNGYDGHTGDLKVFRDGQGRSWSGSGFRNYCDFCGSSIITRGSCPPVWDCHPGKKHRRETAPGLSNPGRRQESSDRQWPQQPRVEGMGWAGLAELIPQGRPPTLHTLLQVISCMVLLPSVNWFFVFLQALLGREKEERWLVKVRQGASQRFMWQGSWSPRLRWWMKSMRVSRLWAVSEHNRARVPSRGHVRTHTHSCSCLYLWDIIS